MRANLFVRGGAKTNFSCKFIRTKIEFSAETRNLCDWYLLQYRTKFQVLFCFAFLRHDFSLKSVVWWDLRVIITMYCGRFKSHGLRIPAEKFTFVSARIFVKQLKFLFPFVGGGSERCANTEQLLVCVCVHISASSTIQMYLAKGAAS